MPLNVQSELTILMAEGLSRREAITILRKEMKLPQINEAPLMGKYNPPKTNFDDLIEKFPPPDANLNLLDK